VDIKKEAVEAAPFDFHPLAKRIHLNFFPEFFGINNRIWQYK
jgi:hypothetical protein